jgi:hypothetical protein
MKPRLLRLAATVCLLLAAFLEVLAIRSYWRCDFAIFETHDSDWVLFSDCGSVCVENWPGSIRGSVAFVPHRSGTAGERIMEWLRHEHHGFVFAQEVNWVPPRWCVGVPLSLLVAIFGLLGCYCMYRSRHVAAGIGFKPVMTAEVAE